MMMQIVPKLPLLTPICSLRIYWSYHFVYSGSIRVEYLSFYILIIHFLWNHFFSVSIIAMKIDIFPFGIVPLLPIFYKISIFFLLLSLILSGNKYVYSHHWFNIVYRNFISFWKPVATCIIFKQIMHWMQEYFIFAWQNLVIFDMI